MEIYKEDRREPDQNKNDGYVDGISRERVAISVARILKIIGNDEIEYNEWEKFAMGLLIT
jgi:hypothetical protein